METHVSGHFLSWDESKDGLAVQESSRQGSYIFFRVVVTVHLPPAGMLNSNPHRYPSSGFCLSSAVSVKGLVYPGYSPKEYREIHR